MLCWHVAIVWPGLRAAYFVFYVASVVKALHGIIIRIAIRVLLITFKKVTFSLFFFHFDNAAVFDELA